MVKLELLVQARPSETEKFDVNISLHSIASRDANEVELRLARILSKSIQELLKTIHYISEENLEKE